MFFFTPRGSVESFPLPERQRRYVLRTPTHIPAYTSDYLGTELQIRTGISVSNARQVWESSFGVQRNLADCFARDNVFLCGDAAHLMSPVGGQNMNTGFADAELACWLAHLVSARAITFQQAAPLYNRVRGKAARTAIRRAHCMMVAATCGGHIWSALRSMVLDAAVQTPLRQLLLRQLSMQSIPFRNLEHYKAIYEAELNL